MYADPSLIRDVFVKVRLNDAEAELLDAIVKYTGQQKSTLVRELFMEQARLVLSGKAALSPYEAEIADKLAAAFDITRDEVVSSLVKDAMSRRLRKNTGHRPARVYDIKRKEQQT
jgi:hypothetical protein